MRSDVQRAFGYPKFWQKNNSRLQQFLDEILPTAARLEVSHLAVSIRAPRLLAGQSEHQPNGAGISGLFAREWGDSALLLSG